MANRPIIHIASVNGPLWNKTFGNRAGPKEVKFHSQRRHQEIFYLKSRFKGK